MSLWNDSIGAIGRAYEAVRGTRPPDTVRVVADAQFPTAEICVLDSQFRIVGQAIGVYTGDLPPGLYLVQYKAGRTVKEQQIFVAPGQGTLLVPAPELTPRSSAPLDGTPAGEGFGAVAVTESQVPGPTVGAGDGQLFLFVRDAATDGGPDTDAVNRLGDLEIFAFDGALFDDKPSVTQASVGRSGPDGKWHACNVVLPAGAYGVRCRLDDEFTLAHTVVVSRGWQTQAFYSPRTYRRAGPVRAPDLARAAVSMAKVGRGFSPHDRQWAWTEAARISLAAQQAAAPRAALLEAVKWAREVRGTAGRRDDFVRQILPEKFVNPMLGILGAHLLVLDPKRDLELLREVVDNLEVIVPDHPDVTALRYLVGGVPVSVGAPPMLRSSWRLLVDRSVEDPDVIAEGSYAARVVRQVWGGGAWLVWTEGPRTDLEADVPPLPERARLGAPRTEATSAVTTAGGTDTLESLVNSLFETVRATAPRHSTDRYIAWQAQRLRLDDDQRRIFAYLVRVATQDLATIELNDRGSPGFMEPVVNLVRRARGQAIPLTPAELGDAVREERERVLSVSSFVAALGIPQRLLRQSMQRLATSLEGGTTMAANPRVCFDRILPGDLDKVRPVMPISGARSKAAFEWAKLWDLGQTLRVSYLGGTAAQRSIVEQFAPQWSQHANLKFEFGNAPNADIRISFVASDGAWSFIGTDCRSIPLGQATMNLGWQDEGVVLHEFGHAIGLIHEHQNPVGGIKWNKPAVYRDLAGSPNFWDPATIDRNMFQTYERDQINGTTLDKKSIMLYEIPASWTEDGWSSTANEVLSTVDKEFAHDPRNYPSTGPRQPHSST